MDSKLEVRAMAVKLAAKVSCVNDYNIIDVSKKIEAYILGDAKLPETNTTEEKTNGMMEKIISAMGMNHANAYTAYGTCCERAFDAEDEPPLTEEELLKHSQGS